MKASLKIVNKTKWNTDHLRAFVMRARAEVFGEHARGKKLVVTFVTSRRYGSVSGYAYIGGTNSRIRIPKDAIDKRSLAQILKHELAHNAGANGERWMRRSKDLGFRHPEWRQTVEWADALPLEKAAPKPKPTKGERVERALAIAQRRKKEWQTRAKRAATALKKWTRRVAQIEKRAAAMNAAKEVAP